jgi:hypothetical protein
LKKLLAALDAESRELAIAIGWLLLVQVLAVAAWTIGLLSRDAAVIHWVLLGVLPPAMALARMTRPPPG